MTRAGDGHESSHDRHNDETRPAANGQAEAEAGPTETEPDARFTLANERTFLAWSRTALALVAAGLAIVQLLPPFPGVPLGRHVVGIPLIGLGAVIAVVAYVDMTRNQRALRRAEPLPGSVLPRLLAGTIGGVAIVAAVVVLLSATR
jgi:putative membrane protein